MIGGSSVVALIIGCTTEVPTLPNGGVPLVADSAAAALFDSTFYLFAYNNVRASAYRGVLTRASDWSSGWSPTGSSHSPSTPAVDFNSNVVVLVAMGALPSASAYLTIDEVKLVDGAVYVLVDTHTSDCGAAQVVSFPMAVKLIPKRPEAVKFVEKETFTRCR